MSYRGFKRLFGETSIERKCRIILGLGMLSLVSASFFFYGNQTEKLVWDQTKKKAAILVHTALIRRHFPNQIDGINLTPPSAPPSKVDAPQTESSKNETAKGESGQSARSTLLDKFQDSLPEDLRKYEV